MATLTTKFEIGDRVTTGTVTGEIVDVTATLSKDDDIVIVYYLKLDGKKPVWEYANEKKLTKAPEKLSPEAAWATVGLLFGRLTGKLEGFLYFDDNVYREMRHQAYIILGGNGVDVGREGTGKHEEVRAELNRMIDLALGKVEGRATILLYGKEV